VTSLLGTIRVDRAYYYCKHCRRGTCPGDAVPGLTAADPTPGALEVMTLAGVLGGFAVASTVVLRRMSGLRVSESTVRRLTEAVGADVGERLNHGQTFGPDTPWDWHKNAEGKIRAYLAIDATGVPQQGPVGGLVLLEQLALAGQLGVVDPDGGASESKRWRSSWVARTPASLMPRWMASSDSGMEGPKETSTWMVMAL